LRVDENHCRIGVPDVHGWLLFLSLSRGTGVATNR
jgi:hypothetical protein